MLFVCLCCLFCITYLEISSWSFLFGPWCVIFGLIEVRFDVKCSYPLAKMNLLVSRNISAQCNDLFVEMIPFVESKALRLVFTSDGVVVEVVIKSVERYDVVKNETDGVGSRTLILLMSPLLTIK